MDQVLCGLAREEHLDSELGVVVQHQHRAESTCRE